MPNQAKIAQVEDLAKRLGEAKSAALVQYQGLNAAGISSLRDEIRTSGGVMEVAKNSIIERAFEKAGAPLPEELTGPTAITFSNSDELASLKAFEKVESIKDAVVSFKYGYFEGKLLAQEELKKFLSLPSKSQLYAQLLGGLQNPLQRLMYAAKYQQTQFALVIKALADKKAKA